jgi:hypothetical protein
MDFGLVLLLSIPLGGPNKVSGAKASWGISREWNIGPGPCCAIAELGTFSHIIFNGFWTYVVVFHSLRWPQQGVGADTLMRHLQGMKCYTRTLFCHSRTGHFFSYNLQWILDLCCCLPFPEVASTSRWGRRLIEALSGNEMLHQDLVLL